MVFTAQFGSLNDLLQHMGINKPVLTKTFAWSVGGGQRTQDPERPWGSRPQSGAMTILSNARSTGFMKHALVLLALLSLPLAAKADSVVGESVWGRKNAIERARQSLPPGAQVTATDCQEIEVGLGNYHYQCRLTYSDGPSAPAPASP